MSRRVPFIKGKIGPMRGGKSSYLLQMYEVYHRSKRAVVVTQRDDRVGKPCINCHNGVNLEATFVISDGYDLLKKEDVMDYDVFFIDEIQFIKDIGPVMSSLRDMNKLVFFAGLDTDAGGKMWPNTVDALSVADSYEKIMGVCDVCYEDAGFTRMKSGTFDGEIHIGDSEYVVLCSKCIKK